MDIITPINDLDDSDEEIFNHQSVTDTDNLKDIRETLQEFLNANNFDTSSEPVFKDMTHEDFVKFVENNQNEEIMKKFSETNIEETLRSSMSNIYINKDKKNKIFVFFLPTSNLSSSVGIDVIKKFSKLVIIFGCTEGVIISEKPFTATAQKMIQSSNNIESSNKEDIFNLISYKDDEFFNIIDHCLSPEVIKIYSGKELEEFIKEENVDANSFPKITIDDPVVKFFRGKLGDVIKMKRKTGITNSLINEQIVYRIVVHRQFKSKK